VADRRPVWVAGRPSPGTLKGRSGVSDFVLAYTVDSAGRVDSATVAASANTVPDFPTAVRRAAPAWRFRPATLQGCAVPYTVVDTVRIRIGPAH
jgi:TonB family protein